MFWLKQEALDSTALTFIALAWWTWQNVLDVSCEIKHWPGSRNTLKTRCMHNQQITGVAWCSAEDIVRLISGGCNCRSCCIVLRKSVLTSKPRSTNIRMRDVRVWAQETRQQIGWSMPIYTLPWPQIQKLQAHITQVKSGRRRYRSCHLVHAKHALYHMS